MRPQDHPDTAELITRRMVVEAQVHAALDQFLSAKRTEVGEASFQHLTAVAAKDILGVQSELRQVLVQTAKANQSFNSEAYWLMVDAIGFVADSIKGRWPYMGVKDRDNALSNALATVSLVARRAALEDGEAEDDDDAGVASTPAQSPRD